MFLRSPAIMVLILFAPIVSRQQTVPRAPAPVEITGRVVDAESGKPLANIYLFITEGEEEAVTDARGGFRIRTWKKLPVILTSQDLRYRPVRLEVTSASKTVTVKLRPKKGYLHPGG